VAAGDTYTVMVKTYPKARCRVYTHYQQPPAFSFRGTRAEADENGSFSLRRVIPFGVLDGPALVIAHCGGTIANPPGMGFARFTVQTS